MHCGDVGGEAVFEQFAGLRTWFVWGNMDFPDPTLERYVESLGVQAPRVIPVEIELDGHTIAVYHGHESHFTRLMRPIERRDFAAFGKLTAGWDYVLFGHTHRATDTRVEHVRLINPGALQRARVFTVATLDLARDTLKFWVVDEHVEETEHPREFVPR